MLRPPLRFALLMVACALHAAMGATEDITPPELRAFSIQPAVVDVSDESPTVQLELRLTDDLSGFVGSNRILPTQAGGSVVFTSFGADGRAQSTTVRVAPFHRHEGDEWAGTYTNALLLPRLGRPATWVVAQIDLTDAAGNRRQWRTTDLRRLGFSTQFVVQGTGEAEPPLAVSVTVSPTSANTAKADQELVVALHVRDNLAGLDRLPGNPAAPPPQLSFVSPSRKQRVGALFLPTSRQSGDAWDGVYTNTVRLPRYSEPGIWTLDGVFLADAVGNERGFDPSLIAALGLSAEFTVIGPGDTEPPSVQALDFSPRWVDTSGDSQTIHFELEASDRLSGLVPGGASWSFATFATLTFSSPSGKQFNGVSFVASMRRSGTEFEGTYTNSLILPRYAETGVWTLVQCRVSDAVGNSIVLGLPEMQRLGFPTQFAVGIAPTLSVHRQPDVLILHWPSWATDFALESRSDEVGTGAWTLETFVPWSMDQTSVVSLLAARQNSFYRLVRRP